MTDESRIIEGVKQDNLPIPQEKSRPKRIVNRDDGEAGPTCDPKTGKCSD